MALFDIGNYGGLKLRDNRGFFSTQGLPQEPALPSPVAIVTPGQGQGEVATPLGADAGDKGAGGIGVPPDGQQPQWVMPSANPYTQKQENYQYLLDKMGTFQTAYQTMVAPFDPNDWSEGSIEARKREFLKYSDQFNDMKSELSAYGIEMGWDAEFGGNLWFSVPGSTEGMYGFEKISGYLQGETTRLGERAAQHDEFAGFMQGFQDWATNFEAGNVTVDPFADPNGWDQLVQDIFGDMAALPDIQNLLQGMYSMMPVWEYTADALPNLSAPERTAKFFEDLKSAGFDMGQMEGGLDQNLRDWLYKMARDLQPSRMFEQLGLDLTKWNEMTTAQMAEITKLLDRKSVFDEGDTRRYLDIQMRNIKNINEAEYNAHLNVLAEKGITHGGAAVRSAQELQQRLGDAEMTATADLFMQGITLAEQGRFEALQAFSQISDTQAELLLNIGGLKTTLFGQYFDFLQGIGNISASEFATATEAHVAEATLKLKYELGVAGLEIDKYVSDRGLDLEGLKLEYDNYWRDRGADLTEKEAEFDASIAAWQTSAMMAEMVNNGRTERLVQMANLALQAQSGDREAWSAYQQLALRERLEQRGMDINQAQMMADLVWQKYQLGENVNLTRWVEQYRGELQKELTRMGIKGKADLMRLEAELNDDGFWGDVLGVVGGVVKLGTVIFGKKDNEEDDDTNPGAGGDDAGT